MKLFERFDKVYLINLSHRKDRLVEFNKEIEKYNLGIYYRFEAINGKFHKKKYQTSLNDGEVGIILTNIEILKDAKKNDYKEILIIEDDCSFTEEILNIESYFKELPNDWKMLYFGGNHNTHIGVNSPKVINDKVIKLHHTYSAHFVVLKNDIFDELLFSLSLLNKQLDVIYAEIQKRHIVYSFYPAIAKQRADFSDIQNKQVDYNWLIK